MYLNELIEKLGSKKFRLPIKFRFIKNQTLAIQENNFILWVQKPYEMWDCPTRMALVVFSDKYVKVGMFDPIASKDVQTVLNNMREIKLP